MIDLSVDFAGLYLQNPIIFASGGPGWDGEHLKRCALAGAGAVVPKSLGPLGDGCITLGWEEWASSNWGTGPTV